MRYELYRLEPAEDKWFICFDKESNNISVLCQFIEDYKSLDTKFTWIIIDNEPTTFNLHNLGFAEIPTREELKQRIFECKFNKYFDVIEISFDEISKFYNTHKDEYLQKAEKEAEELLNKLYQYEPIITNSTLENRIPKQKKRLVRNLSSLSSNWE